MPAFTPTEPKLLDAVADAEGAARPVAQVATATNSFEGAGFPVRRPFPGRARPPLHRPVPDARPDGPGRLRARPGEGRTRPPAPRVRDGHLPARRRDGAPRLVRGRRRDPRRGDPVDDRGPRARALRDADRGDDARRRPYARCAALGEPPAGRQGGRAALPGPHRRPAHVVPQRGRRRDRPSDRGRPRRPPRAREHAHADRVRARDAATRSAPRPRLAAGVQRARVRALRTRSRRRRHRAGRRSGRRLRRAATCSWSTPMPTPPSRSRCCSSVASRSASRCSPTAPS